MGRKLWSCLIDADERVSPVGRTHFAEAAETGQLEKRTWSSISGSILDETFCHEGGSPVCLSGQNCNL